MKHRIQMIYGSLILWTCVCLLLTAGLSDGLEKKEVSTVLTKGQYYNVEFKATKGETLKYHVEVKEGKGVDVYLLPNNQYSRYRYKQSFTPTFKHHNITVVGGTFEIPDNNTYYFVVDNANNAMSNDTIPEGNVTIKSRITLNPDDIEASTEVMRMQYLVSISFIVVGIGSVVAFIIGKKKKKASPNENISVNS